jgi:predicted transcriptional regulator
MEGTRRGGRRQQQLLGDIKNKRRYCNLKVKALVCALWRTDFGRGHGVVAKTAYAVKSSSTLTSIKGIKSFNL